MSGYTFGIELEMFDHTDDDLDDDCDCEDCEEARSCGEDRYRPADMALSIFKNYGLCEHDRLCCYHCDCDLCAYDRHGVLLAAQQDSTVGAEFVSRILSPHSNNDMADLRDLVGAYRDVQDATGWIPYPDDNAGNHIHVSHPNIAASTVTKAKAAAYMAALMGSNGDLWQTQIATGGRSTVRSYNGPAPREGAFHAYGYDVGSSWVRARYNTIEIRVWNTPSDPDRLLVHPALSIALIDWAMTEAEADEHSSASAIANEVWMMSEKHHRRLADIVKKSWGHRPSAERAAALLTA